MGPILLFYPCRSLGNSHLTREFETLLENISEHNEKCQGRIIQTHSLPLGKIGYSHICSQAGLHISTTLKPARKGFVFIAICCLLKQSAGRYRIPVIIVERKLAIQIASGCSQGTFKNQTTLASPSISLHFPLAHISGQTTSGSNFSKKLSIHSASETSVPPNGRSGHGHKK